MLRITSLRQFDANFFENCRSAGQAPAKRFDESIIALGALRPRCRARLLWERRRRRQPETNEERYRLERNPVIAFKPLEHPHDAIEPLGDRSLPPIGIVRRKK